MAKNKIMIVVIALTMLVLLTSCRKSTNSSDSNETSNVLDSVGDSKQNDSDSSIDKSKIELNHTYATRFEEVNQVTYPTFYFDYPDGWTVTSEEVTDISEEVTLTNNRGATVTYWHFGGMRELTGPTSDISCVDVTKVTDVCPSFQPSYVQAGDYSDLGPFMVARLKITGGYDMEGGGEYIEIKNGSVRYALLPESQVGEQQECSIIGLPTFSFWYAGHISLIAGAPDGAFTEQEEQEVIAILASFRNTFEPLDISPSPENNKTHSLTDNNTAATIDELWEMLNGTWTFEEYEHMGKVVSYHEHTMEFHYVDGKPCMSRYAQIDGGYFPDTIFYDFSALDETHYTAYIYKKGNYGGDWENWSSDVLNVWYSFDLSNLSDGKLILGYHMAWDNGFIDNNHVFKYSLA